MSAPGPTAAQRRAATPSSYGPGRPAQQSFRLVMWAAGVLYVLAFAYYGYRSTILQPFSDQFDLIATYLDYKARGVPLDYWLTPHANHRIPLYRLLVAVDTEVFHLSGFLYVAVAAFGIAALAMLLCREANRAATPELGLAAAVLTLMLLLSTANAADVAIPIITPAVHTAVFAVLAVLLAEPAEGERRGTTALLRLAALACACAAALSNAVGLAIWPVLAFRAFRGGQSDRLWLAIVLGTAAVFVALYLHADFFHGEGENRSLGQVMRSIDYLVAYLGLPWVRASEVVGRLVGAGILACALLVIFKTGGPRAGRTERVACGLVAFSLATAVLAAIGRRDATGAGDVPLRYAIYLAPLHVGLLLLVLPALGRLWRARPGPVEAAIATVVGVLLVQQVVIGQVAARYATEIRWTITAFQRGERTPLMSSIIHPNLGRAQAVSDQIRFHLDDRSQSNLGRDN